MAKFSELMTTYLFSGSGVVSVLHAHLLEQIIQCLLMKGDTARAADKVSAEGAGNVIGEYMDTLKRHPQSFHYNLGGYILVAV